jgi:hypothetical protein
MTSGYAFLFTLPKLALLGARYGSPAAIPVPVHDPPVAWHVENHPYARVGIPVIACPGMSDGRVKLLAPGGYMDPAPVVLDREPGRRP